MNKNNVIITSISVVLISLFLVVAYIATSGPKKINYPEVNVVNADDRVKWAKDKKNILVEYSDLQCPACQNFHTFLNTSIERGENKDLMKKVTFVYRHFPLTMHKNAMKAAYAAEAAALQGKFYEMIDLLFENQAKWAEEDNPDVYFVDFAKQLKLDVDKFNTDRNSKTVKDKVQKDQSSGGQADVNATPTFYLNGEKLEIGSFDDLIARLKELP